MKGIGSGSCAAIRANLSGANLTGANLRGARLSGVNLARARGNTSTTWPKGFDPKAAGVIFE